MSNLVTYFPLLVLAALSVGQNALANGGPVSWSPEAPQGDLRVVAETQISLTSEVLSLEVRGEKYWVKAAYTLKNPGPAKTVQFGVPLVHQFGETEPVSNFSITIDGAQKGCERVTAPNAQPNFEKPGNAALAPEGDEATRWCVTSIRVPQGDAVSLNLAYESVLQFNDWATNKHWRQSYSARSLIYRLAPAGYWAGNPKTVSINLDLGENHSKSKVLGPPGFVREGRKVTWRLTGPNLSQLKALRVDYALNLEASTAQKESLKVIEEGKFPFYARGNERIVRHAIQGHSEISASSTLKGKREKSYHANNLLDGDLKTAWCEGVAGPGHGEFIEVKLKGVAKLCPTREMTYPTLVMVSGYAKSKRIWAGNNRVTQVSVKPCGSQKPGKKFKIDERSFDAPASSLALVEPNDHYGEENFFMPVAQSMFQGEDVCVRVTLTATAEGNGSKDNDTCLSELALNARCWVD